MKPTSYQNRVSNLSDSGNVQRMFSDQPVRRPGPPVTLGAATRGFSGNSAGCCEECIDCRYMTVGGGIYSRIYRASGIPESLIPSDAPNGALLLHYVGLADGTDIAGATDGNPYWESDAFAYSCVLENPCVYGVSETAECDEDCPCDTSQTISFPDPVASTGGALRTLSYAGGCEWTWFGVITESLSEVWNFNASDGTISITFSQGGGNSSSAVYSLPEGVTYVCGCENAFTMTSSIGDLPEGTSDTIGSGAECSDSYFWRLVVHGDGNGACPAVGSENADLFIVHEGSGTICAQLTGVNCGPACGDSDGTCDAPCDLPCEISATICGVTVSMDWVPGGFFTGTYPNQPGAHNFTVTATPNEGCTEFTVGFACQDVEGTLVALGSGTGNITSGVVVDVAITDGDINDCDLCESAADPLPVTLNW